MRVEAFLVRFGLETHADRAVSTLSRGLQQRLSLARALLHGPDLLLLDEPTAALDADGVRLLVDTLSALRAAGATVVVATHAFDALLELADRMAVLVGGELRVAGPRGTLAAAELAGLYADAVGAA